MPKTYEPGDRGKRYTREPGKYSEIRYAWASTEIGKFIILVGDQSRETGDDVVLYIPRAGKLPDLTLSLTHCTEQELEAVKDIIDSAFEWARPIVQLRDKEAQDAWNKGDDSFARNYRPVPQLVYRKRPNAEHSLGVHERSTRVPEGDRRATDSDGGVRGIGDELAEPDSSEDGSKDNGTQVNES